VSNGRAGDRASALQQIPANMVDRIEVITNPSAEFRAEGSAGVINIVLKKEIGNLRGLMQGKMNDYHRVILEILTPEQQNRLETIGRQRGFSHGPRWGEQRLGSP